MKLQVTSSKSVVLLHIILLKICFEVIIINIYVTCPSNFEYKKPARLQLNWSLFITFVVLNNYLPKNHDPVENVSYNFFSNNTQLSKWQR